MAVIDTSMDIPKDCKSCQNKNCSYPEGFWLSFDENGLVQEGRNKDCPLKSIDEMLSEIEQIESWNLSSREMKEKIVTLVRYYCKLFSE